MKNTRTTLVMVAICVTAICAFQASAQETTGVLRGSIISPDGVPLPGVTITVLNPSTGLQRVDVSGGRGEYAFMALPPGRYELNATMDGFQSHKQTFDVSHGRTLTNDFEMALGAVSDVIVVTGEAPIVDVTSTVSGITLSTADINDKVPVIRDTQRISMLAPATVTGDTAFNGANDGTYDQRLVSIGGASVAENSYQVNGLNITNFRTGVGSSWVPFEFVEEIQVKTGGYEAEFGRSTGGVVNMVTRSGTNSLHGGASLYFEPESLQKNEPDTVYRYNQMEQREVLEANLSLGGPLYKDRLFIFGFLQYRDTDYLNNTTSTAKREKGGEPYYGGKLDWNMTSNHRFELTYMTDKTSIDDTLYAINDNVIDFDTVSSTGERSRGGDNYIAKYTGIFADNFLISAQFGVNNFDRSDAATGDIHPYAKDNTSGDYVRIQGWTNAFRGMAEDEREAARIDADLYFGNHSLRAGVDYEYNYSLDQQEYSGGYRAYYHTNQDRFPDLDPGQILVDYRVYQAAGDFDTSSNAIYLQDSWSVTPSVTLNLGIRWEQYENKNVNGETFIKINDQYAPRLGVIWDTSGEGRSKLYASYGVYHLPIASNTNIRMAGTELYVADWYAVDGWGPQGEPLGIDFNDPLDHQRVYSDGLVPDVRSVAQENLEPMAQEEIIVGYEQALGDNWSLGARAVSRSFSTVIEDIGGDWAMWDVYGLETRGWWGILANPGGDVSAWYDLDGDGDVERYSFTAEELDYPEAERNYYAVELTAKRRFSSKWMLDMSYTWSHGYGNYEGYVDSTIGQSDGGITQLFDYPGLMEHSYGNLPNDRRHNLKAFGVYLFDFGLQLGGNAYFASGRPVNGQGVYPDPDNWASDYLVASFYVQGEPAPRGGFGSTDDLYGLDAMLKYDISLGPGDLSLRLDVFNLFNNSAITEVDEAGDDSAGNAAPNWLAPTHYQQPRSVRLGVGYTF